MLLLVCERFMLDDLFMLDLCWNDWFEKNEYRRIRTGIYGGVFKSSGSLTAEQRVQ